MKRTILLIIGLCLLVSPCLGFTYDEEAIVNPQMLTVDETVTVDFTMKFIYSEAEILEHFIAMTKLVDTEWTVEILNSGNQVVTTKHYKDRSIAISYFDFAYQDSSTVNIHLIGKVSSVDAGKSITVFNVYTQKAKRNNGNEIYQSYKTPDMYVFTQNEIQNMYDELNAQVVTIKAKIELFKQLGIDTTSMETTLQTILYDFETFKNQQNPDNTLKTKIENECIRLLAEIKGYENQVVESNLQWAYENLPNTQLFRDKYNAVLISWQNGEPNMEASIELVNAIKNNGNNGGTNGGFNPLFLLIPLGIIGILFLFFKGKKGRKSIGDFREDRL